MNSIHTHLTTCAAEAARVAGLVTAEQLSAPSVCEDWEVRELVNHLVLYTSHGLEHRALRKQLPEELTKRDFTATDDWAERYAAQLDRALAAWSDPAAWEGDVDLGFMTMPASEIASLLVKELAVHGWDLARSIGQDFEIAHEAGQFVLRVVEEHAEVYRQYDGFAEPVPVADDFSAFERALATSGRDPRA
ncbi:TIGR03086 family metal-binding protein [Streptomyces sp. NBC_00322]|uniref:TIGR03086 family metal-binding protein n=1 Tax=Streptomyces sp. NBC_00322 TaxID=2975712 RepID=UPI002E27B54C|nr:TIGR03086 family metal-binding protein [Streptomyces sp. NBC_00322]